MSYYKDRTECLNTMLKVLRTEKKLVRTTIYAWAMTKYGFGKLLVNRILEPLEKAGIIEEHMYIWIYKGEGDTDGERTKKT